MIQKRIKKTTIRTLRKPLIKKNKSRPKQPGLVVLAVFFTVFFFLSAQAERPNISHPKNALYQHPSAYLALHGQDPIDWQPWSEAIIQRAQKTKKLIFISSGYFACHWCHVIHQESFQDLEFARFLNQHFIAVKLDRELNPALDDYLIEFSKQTSGKAGWPQQAILTPEGFPFFAFGYQPKAQLLTTLNKTLNLWQAQIQQIQKLAQQYSAPLPQQTTRKPLSQAELKKIFYSELEAQIDPLEGGLGQSQRFPPMTLLLALLKDAQRPKPVDNWLLLTLEQMQNEHLFDHVNGGFYRYTIDPSWQTPHFEKMTYNQALLAEIYFRAAQQFERKDFLQTAQATLAYLQQRLFQPQNGLFAASQSAIDSRHREGGNYLFTRQQLARLLSAAEQQQIEQDWQMDRTSQYEIDGEPAWHPKPTRQYWLSIRKKLKLSQQNQTIPTDTTALLDWNGLVLSALIQDYRIQPKEPKRTRILHLIQTLSKWLLSENPPHALTQKGQSIGQATLADYAYLIRALKQWQETEPSEYSKALLRRLQSLTKQKFLTPEGWQTSLQDRLPDMKGIWIEADNPLPSPITILGQVYPQAASFATPALLDDPLRYASTIFSMDLK